MLNRDHVVWAYRLFLDREPESEEVLLGWVGACQTAAELREHFLGSAEFRRKNPAVHVEPPDLQGIALPPDELLSLVSGTTDAQWFLRSGKLGASLVLDVVRRQGIDWTTSSVLDFGCGCGRVLRHFSSERPGQLFGCDYNPKLVRWSREHLTFASFSENELRPPLSWADGTFDVVFAFSTFTHWTEDLQTSWMKELRRVLRASGLLVFTVHGESYLYDLDDKQRRRFEAGALVVKHAEASGTNTCGAYHPRRYVEGLSRLCGFEVVEHVPQGARGNPHQDLYVARAL